MIRVAIETATAVGTVAVARDGDLLAESELGAQRRHAETVLVGLDDALERAGVARPEIGEVVVGAGPGSFTGVRVAGATAKGLAAGLDVPLVAYPSLLALAAAAALDDPASDRPVLALFDARRGDVFGGCWRVGDEAIETVLAPTVGPVESVVAQAVAEAVAEARTVVVVGDGAVRYRDRIGGAEARDRPGWPRAGALLWLAARHRALGTVADAASWEPLYVRDSTFVAPATGVSVGGAGGAGGGRAEGGRGE